MTATILVVDDSATIRQLTTAVLSASDFEVVEAHSTESALEVAAATDKIDAFLLDVNMPGTDGLTLLRRLKAQSRFKDTPVFMITTEERKTYIDEGKRLGATAWIIKPFKPNALIAGLRKALESS